MPKKIFTAEELEILKSNKYVKNVSEITITYTNDFRKEYTNLVKDGYSKKEAFRKLGFDPEMLGKKRVCSYYERTVKRIKENIPPDDKRFNNAGRKEKVNFDKMSETDQIEYLKHENIMLKAENELLKKMEFLVKQKQLKKSQQVKDIS